MRCPVCRAQNSAEETTCRRCKADLSLLVEMDKAREHVLAQAARAAAVGDGVKTLRFARSAHNMRRDADSWRWLAIGNLLMGDFGLANLCHRQCQNAETASEALR
jgi:hypothetical protein